MSCPVAECGARLPAETLRERYEGLRARVLCGTQRWDPAAGMAVLFAWGLREWMERGAPPPPPAEPKSPSAGLRPAMAPAHAQLGAIIAEMILAPLSRRCS